LRQTGEGVVNAEHDRAARLGESRELRERRPRVRRVVQDPRRIDNVERSGAETGFAEIGFDELHTFDPETLRRRGRKPKRCTSEIGPDDQSIGARQVQAHLAGPASNLDDARVAGNGVIDQTGENVALGPRAKRLQAVAGRVAWKRRALVKAAHDFGAVVTRQAQVGNSVRRLESSATIAA
jgi:hypothetical protein